jgi:hypothetical protein
MFSLLKLCRTRAPRPLGRFGFALPQRPRASRVQYAVVRSKLRAEMSPRTAVASAGWLKPTPSHTVFLEGSARCFRRCSPSTVRASIASPRRLQAHLYNLSIDTDPELVPL